MPLANPFWSEKTQEAMKISAARPSDLPRVPTDDELEDYVEPLQQGTGAEKRQWSRPRGHHVATRSGPSSGERFVTPAMSLQAPSSWIHAEEIHSSNGQKTEGPLPASSMDGGSYGLPDGQSRLEDELGKLMFEQFVLSSACNWRQRKGNMKVVVVRWKTHQLLGRMCQEEMFQYHHLQRHQG